MINCRSAFGGGREVGREQNTGGKRGGCNRAAGLGASQKYHDALTGNHYSTTCFHFVSVSRSGARDLPEGSQDTVDLWGHKIINKIGDMKKMCSCYTNYVHVSDFALIFDTG